MNETRLTGSIYPLYYNFIDTDVNTTTTKQYYGKVKTLFDGWKVHRLVLKTKSDLPFMAYLQHVQTKTIVMGKRVSNTFSFENVDFENYEIWSVGLATMMSDSLDFEWFGNKTQDSIKSEQECLDVWLPILQTWQEQQTLKQELEKERLSQIKSNPVQIKQLDNGKSVPVFQAMSNQEMSALLENKKKEQELQKQRIMERQKCEIEKELEFRKIHVKEKDPNSDVFVLPE